MKNNWKKIVSLLCTLFILLSMVSVVNAYPNQGLPNTVQPPENRSYFPTDILQLPSSKGLNDPFVFLNPELGTNGRVVTAADWEARRDEIRDILQYYYFGYKWPTAKSDVTSAANTNTDGTIRTINGTLTITVSNPDNEKTASFTATGVYIPIYRDVPFDQLGTNETNVPPPYPVVIGVAGSFERNQTLKRGYAVMNLNTGAVYSDNVNRTGAYTTLYPFDGTQYEYNSGALMGWAWGISRIIDALENGAYEGLIDPTKTVVTGVSRNGKAAQIAGAFDDRISLTVPVDPGQSGTASFRFTNEGQLFNYKVPNAMERVYARNEKPTNVLSDSEAHWLNWKAEDFRYNTDRLPFDAHLIEALCAPRPQITFTGEEFDWLGSPGTCMTMTAAQEVYEFLGAGGNVAVRVHDGAHAIQNRDVGYCLAIMDQLFHRDGEGQYVVENVYTTNPPSYGMGTYDKISDMTAYPYELDSSYVQWARPGKYILWSDIQAVTEGIPATITVHTDADAVMMSAPSGATYTADTVSGIAVFNLTAAQVEEGRYSLTTIGTDKDANTAYFQGMCLSDALRHGISVNNTGGSGTPPIYGFTSKINQNAIQLFKDGVQIQTTVNEGEKIDDVAIPGYILPYGARIDNSPAYNVATLKNLQLEALPGYTFEVSFDRNVFMSFPSGSTNPGSREKPSWASANTKIGPQPDWPPYPNSTSDNGIRSVPPRTTTNFRTDIAFSLSGNDVSKDTNQLIISFSTPVNRNEFGIGFDFTDNWTLNWAEDNQSVTVDFDNSRLDWGMTCNIIIFRLRDMDKNMIGTPDQDNSEIWYAGPVTADFTIAVTDEERVVLEGPNEILTGMEFTVDADMRGVEDGVYAQDILITYDSLLFSLLEVEGADGVQVLSPDDETVLVPGMLRVIAFSPGGLTGDAPLFKLKFQAAEVVGQTGQITVASAKLGVAPAGTVIEAVGTTLPVSIIGIPVTGVSLDKTSLSFNAAGQSDTLTATVEPANATNRDVTWSSSNTAVATVNNGVVTAVGDGTAVITVTTVDGGKTATCTVTVNTSIAVEGVSLDTTSLYMTKAGQSAQLTATIEPDNATNRNVTWSSSNTAAATVNNGVVTAVGNGTAVITVTTADGGKTATCTVTVLIGDLNGNSSIDIGDLAVAAYYYNTDSSSENWAQAQAADVDNDGDVDIVDLATIARSILN